MKIKEYNVHFVGDNIRTETLNYVWKKDKNGHAINKPVDDFNHLIDAIRYSLSIDNSDIEYNI